MLGYAKEKHPDAAAQQDIRYRINLTVQAHMRGAQTEDGQQRGRGKCSAAAPVTVSRLQLRPSVRITYRSALRGHSSTLRVAHAIAMGSNVHLTEFA